MLHSKQFKEKTEKTNILNPLPSCKTFSLVCLVLRFKSILVDLTFYQYLLQIVLYNNCKIRMPSILLNIDASYRRTQMDC